MILRLTTIQRVIWTFDRGARMAALQSALKHLQQLHYSYPTMVGADKSGQQPLLQGLPRRGDRQQKVVRRHVQGLARAPRKQKWPGRARPP
jgi:hypothetical protein